MCCFCRYVLEIRDLVEKIREETCSDERQDLDGAMVTLTSSVACLPPRCEESAVEAERKPCAARGEHHEV